MYMYMCVCMYMYIYIYTCRDRYTDRYTMIYIPQGKKNSEASVQMIAPKIQVGLPSHMNIQWQTVSNWLRLLNRHCFFPLQVTHGHARGPAIAPKWSKSSTAEGASASSKEDHPDKRWPRQFDALLGPVFSQKSRQHSYYPYPVSTELKV